MATTAALSPEAQRAAGLSAPGIAWRGTAMGIAEVVPGVSGGTIALITGVYPLLIEALARFGPGSLRELGDFRAFWQTHQLRFLCLLALGMVAGVIVFGKLMHFLIEHYQPLVWGFFSGVIAMSVWVIGRVRERRTLLLWFPLGLALGVGLVWLPIQAASGAQWYIFVAGMIAVCAWILPAVSGSYIMVVLGLYPAVLAAIDSFDLGFLLVLAAGCLSGLLLFVRVVAWLLRRFYEPLLSLLCGFMAGSLLNIWPWQLAEGERKWDMLVSPADFQLLSGAPGAVVASLMCALAGGLLLWRMSSLDTSTKI